MEFKGRIGSWEIIERLGTGGMGSVYRCRNVHRPSMEVAIKVLDSGAPSGAMQRFQREADVLVRLDHPSIVRIRDFAVEDMRPLLVMDLVEGRTLQEVRNARLLDEAGVASIGAQLASALWHAHRQEVCHRDVKPANAIVRPDGRVVLVDWGIALDEQQARVTATMKLSPATFYYAPPEWIVGDRADPRAWDAYSLGVVLFELLSKKRAFKTAKLSSPMKSVQELFQQKNDRGALQVPGTGPAMRDLIAALTETKPSARLANLGLVASELRAIAASNLPTGVVASSDLITALPKRQLEPLFVEEELDLDDLSLPAGVPITGEPEAPRVAGTRVAAQLGPPANSEKTEELKRNTRRIVAAIAEATGTFTALPDPFGDPLVGRDAEIEAVEELLDAGQRVVLLHGQPGVGRSALGRAVASRQAPESTRSASLLDARGVVEICARVAECLDIPLGADPEGQLGRALAGHGELLLLLDDVPDFATPLLEEWMARAPRLQLLLVAGQPLPLPGAKFVPVLPLTLPTDRSEDSLRGSGAGQVFLQAAKDAGWEPDAGTVAAVHEIVEQVGAEPLALQLLGAQAATRGVDDIAQGLQRRVSRPRSSLEQAIDASLDAAPAATREVFRRLALVHGPVDVAFLEQLVEEPLRPVRPEVDRLVELGLAELRFGPDEVERVDVDPTVRQVAALKLGDASHDGVDRARLHARTVAERIEPDAVSDLRFCGPVRSARWLLEELAELEAAFGTAEAFEDAALATRIGEALSAALEHRGPAAAALDRAERLARLPGLRAAGRRVSGLAQARALRVLGRPKEAMAAGNRAAEDGFRGGDRRLLAQAFAEIGWAMLLLGRSSEAQEHFRTGGELAEGAEAAWCLLGQADCEGLAGRPKAQRARLEEAVAIAEDVQAHALSALAHAQLGRLLARGTDLALAEAHLEAARAIAQGLGSPRLEAQVLSKLAQVARGRGDLQTARARIEEALNLSRRLGQHRAEAVNLSELALVQRLQDEPDAALASLQEAEQLLADGPPLDRARVLGNLGETLLALGRRSEAAKALDQAVERLEALGAPIDAAVLLGSLALVAARGGDFQLASWHLDRAESTLREQGPSDALGLLLARKAEVAARAGQRSAAWGAHAEAGLLAEALNLGRGSELARALAGTKGELGS